MGPGTPPSPSTGSRDVAEVAFGVAHDLRNLLFVISTQLQRVCANLPEGDPLRHDLDAIRDTSDRASALTRYFLSRGNGAPTAAECTDLNDAVRGVRRVLAQVAGPHIRVCTNLARGRLRVRVHATQIEQVLLNLVANARDAMPQGGIVTLTTGRRDSAADGDKKATLTVSDTGEGMCPSIQSRVFDPFYSTKLGGTGIGLTTVRAIAALAGGSIEIDSRTGKGTTVVVSLPMADVRTGEVSQIAATNASVHARRILLVDDEPSIREVLRHFLESRGFELTVACNGKEALQSLDSGMPPDLLVTDVHLPDSVGPDVVRWIRERAPHMPVVFISGAPDAIDAVRRHSSDPVLTKPFSMTELDRAVRAALEPAA